MSYRQAVAGTEPLSDSARRVVHVLVFGLVALAHFTPTQTVQPRILDDGFHAALAYLLDEGFQAGVDYQWTYGPLGHFIAPRYIGSFFWFDYGVKLALALLAAQPIARVIVSHPSRIVAWLLFGCTLSWIQIGSPENGYLAAAAFQSVLVASGRESRRTPLVLMGVAFAFLSLGKFSMFVLFVGFLGYVALALLARGRHQLALVSPLSFVVSLLVFWIAAGQPVANLPAFLVASLEVIPRYNQCFGLPLDTTVWLVSLVACAAALFSVSIGVLSEADRRVRALHVVFCVAFLAITWKSVFVRHFFHSQVLVPAFLLTCSLPPASGAFGFTQRALQRSQLAAVLGCVLAVYVAHDVGYGTNPVSQARYYTTRLWSHLVYAIDPLEHERKLEKGWWQAQQDSRLSAVSKRVGEASIDVLPHYWGALVVNGLAFQPRPLGVESCASGLERNAAHLAGVGAGEAPRFVLFWWSPLDERYPTSEDSQALLEVFSRYEPVLADRWTVLFERAHLGDAARALDTAQVLESGQLAFGERMALPDVGEDWLLLSFEVDSTPWGRLVSLARAPEALSLETRSRTGRVQRHRLPLGLAAHPFLLSPRFETEVRRGRPPVDLRGSALDAFVLDAGEGRFAAYRDPVAYTLYRMPAPAWTSRPIEAAR